MATRATAMAVLLAAAAACSGERGAPGADGRSVILRTSTEPSGAHCPSGGLQVQTGVDDDGSGALDDAEVEATVYVCDGVAGQGLCPRSRLPARGARRAA